MSSHPAHPGPVGKARAQHHIVETDLERRLDCLSRFEPEVKDRGIASSPSLSAGDHFLDAPPALLVHVLQEDGMKDDGRKVRSRPCELTLQEVGGVGLLDFERHVARDLDRPIEQGQAAKLVRPDE